MEPYDDEFELQEEKDISLPSGKGNSSSLKYI